MFDATTLLSGAGLTTAIIGLLVWLTRQSFKRQSEITDRYFKHLEEERASSKEERRENRTVIERLSNAVTSNTESVRELAKAVSHSQGTKA